MNLYEKMTAVKELATGERLKFDDAAFKKFFEDYFVQLCAYCQYKFGFDTDLAKDTVQAGFLRFWETLDTIQPNASPRAYLYKIITNLSLDIVRHRKIAVAAEQKILRKTKESSSGYGLENTDFWQLKSDIDQAVSELPDQMRRIFELCRYEGMKYAEIARTLSVSVKTVETQMSRAMAKLKNKLAGHLVYFFLIALLENIFLSL